MLGHAGEALGFHVYVDANGGQIIGDHARHLYADGIVLLLVHIQA